MSLSASAQLILKFAWLLAVVLCPMKEEGKSRLMFWLWLGLTGCIVITNRISMARGDKPVPRLVGSHCRQSDFFTPKRTSFGGQ
jgi:hypothetical protein